MSRVMSAVTLVAAALVAGACGASVGTAETIYEEVSNCPGVDDVSLGAHTSAPTLRGKVDVTHVANTDTDWILAPVEYELDEVAYQNGAIIIGNDVARWKDGYISAVELADRGTTGCFGAGSTFGQGAYGLTVDNVRCEFTGPRRSQAACQVQADVVEAGFLVAQ